VLGQSFTVDALAAVSGLDREPTEELLRSLVRRELLTHDVDPRSSERGQFAFVQALIREVAYGTLARRDRRSRHLAAARHFEAMGEDELAGALAVHYLAAYRASPDDPDSRPLAAQAKIALRAAATRATSLGSHDQATTFLLEAIEVTEDESEIADLLERAGEASTLSGQGERAEPLLRDAIARREQLGDRSGAARATALLGQSRVNAWRAMEAIEILEPAVLAYADLEDDPALAAIEHQLARAYWFQDRNDEAIPLADRAIGRAERIEATELIADALITKGALLAYTSRPYEGAGILEAGIRLAESLGLHATVVRGLLNLGVQYIGRDPRMALDRSRAAHDLAARFGFRGSYATALGNAGEVAVGLGDWDWALAATGELSVEHLEPGDRASILRTREEILALRGEPVDALLAEHEALVMGHGDSQQESNLHAGRGLAAFAAGRYREAATDFLRSAEMNLSNAPADLPRAARAFLWAGEPEAAREVLDTMSRGEYHGRQMELSRRTVRACLAALGGDPDGAARDFAAVRPAVAELGLVLEEAMLVLDMALVLGPDAPVVQASVDDARATLERLGARALLARLDQLLDAGPADAVRAAGSDARLAPRP
jgi:tetratricopeptide (TPR) repeat protein